MNLYTQHPYWLMKDGLVASYTSLTENHTTDVAIIGAGISGALVAYYLRDSGLRVTVLDRRHVGMGSTAASTAFLQYEIDTPLRKLRSYVGEDNAARSYELCRTAIYDIQHICKGLKPALDFHIRPSLQYASFKKDKDGLYEEYKLRLKYGFDVKWLEPDDIANTFGFTAPAAILSADGGEVDAYLLTHALLADFQQKGHKVFNNTKVRDIEYHKEHVMLRINDKAVVKAKKLIIACGYESQKYIPKKVAHVHTTYALVSEPLSTPCLWYKNSLVWETAQPYLYFRMVNGDRILTGGKDDPWHHPTISNATLKRKTRMLEQSFLRVMKHIPLKSDFSWGGVFNVTKDGLPYIGKIPERPHTLFALGYGGNGITFSVIAANIIRDSLMGKKNKDAPIFDFNR